LADAGIARVVFALSDPNPVASGGAAYLRARGVEVVADADRNRGIEANRAWWWAVVRGRPYVTAKTATTLDGRIAAADGTSKWITGGEARAHAHRIRGEVDAIVVGTRTVIADDPRLGAAGGLGESEGTKASGYQPLRVAMGLRDLPAGARIARDPALLRHYRTHDPERVLAALAAEDVRHVIVEGGARVLGAFLRAGLVDEVHAYVQPMFLGAGKAVVPDLGIETLEGAPRWEAREVRLLGGTAWIRAVKAGIGLVDGAVRTGWPQDAGGSQSTRHGQKVGCGMSLGRDNERKS
jgi:diaminohydroxyphosphoribosylaminopyrimidine deaminase/5-amino-6-(5-phosphoribosylamino)uracil reductase